MRLKVDFPAGDPGDEVVLTPVLHGLNQAQSLIQFSVTSALRSCIYMPDAGQG